MLISWLFFNYCHNCNPRSNSHWDTRSRVTMFDDQAAKVNAAWIRMTRGTDMQTLRTGRATEKTNTMNPYNGTKPGSQKLFRFDGTQGQQCMRVFYIFVIPRKYSLSLQSRENKSEERLFFLNVLFFQWYRLAETAVLGEPKTPNDTVAA